MAESTASGMDRFNAQEKSTMRKDSARSTFRVSSHVRPVPRKL